MFHKNSKIIVSVWLVVSVPWTADQSLRVSTGVRFPVLLFFIVISKGSVCLPAPRRFRNPVRENAPSTDKPLLQVLIVTYEFDFDVVEIEPPSACISYTDPLS